MIIFYVIKKFSNTYKKICALYKDVKFLQPFKWIRDYKGLI